MQAGLDVFAMESPEHKELKDVERDLNLMEQVNQKYVVSFGSCPQEGGKRNCAPRTRTACKYTMLAGCVYTWTQICLHVDLEVLPETLCTLYARLFEAFRLHSNYGTTVSARQLLPANLLNALTNQYNSVNKLIVAKATFTKSSTCFSARPKTWRETDLDCLQRMGDRVGWVEDRAVHRP